MFELRLLAPEDLVETVSDALDDHFKGRALSIPSAQYKLIATAARVVPGRLLQRFQTMGRK